MGDRLKWTRNDRLLGRRNGQEFQLADINDGQILIRYRNGNSDSLSSSELIHLDHALVSTTYAAQGKSAERVIGALDRHVGRESFYVAVSRVKRDLWLYASEDLERLIEWVERSIAKENPGEVVDSGIKHSQPADVGVLVDVGSHEGMAEPNLTPAIFRSVRTGGLER